MPNSIRMWDTLLADQSRFEFMNFVCVQCVLRERSVVLKGDFTTVMECLQSAAEGIEDVPSLISDAIKLKDRYYNL